MGRSPYCNRTTLAQIRVRWEPEPAPPREPAQRRSHHLLLPCRTHHLLLPCRTLQCRTSWRLTSACCSGRPLRRRRTSPHEERPRPILTSSHAGAPTTNRRPATGQAPGRTSVIWCAAAMADGSPCALVPRIGCVTPHCSPIMLPLCGCAVQVLCLCCPCCDTVITIWLDKRRAEQERRARGMELQAKPAAVTTSAMERR